MPTASLGEYLLFMFPNPFMLFLYVGTLSVILTWALLQKHLNLFINAALAIFSCTFELIVTFLMLLISWTAKKIDTYIVQPIENLKKRLHIPIIVRIIFYTLFGIWVFYLDHLHNIKIFDGNEEFIMYPIEIYGIRYWASAIALAVGGSSLGIAVVLMIERVLDVLNRLLDRTMDLRITIYS